MVVKACSKASLSWAALSRVGGEGGVSMLSESEEGACWTCGGGDGDDRDCRRLEICAGGVDVEPGETGVDMVAGEVVMKSTRVVHCPVDGEGGGEVEGRG